MNDIMNKIQSAYIKDMIYVTKEELLKIGWNKKVTTDAMVADLNRNLIEYKITNINSIRHFIAQCCLESDDWRDKGGYGDGLIEIGSYEELSKKEYYPYIGAGYIHLTWKYNYEEFRKYLKKIKNIDDPLIIEQGPKRIAEKYAWEAATYFWAVLNKCNEIASKPNVHPDKLSEIVNKYDERSFPIRAEIYFNKVVPNIMEKVNYE